MKRFFKTLGWALSVPFVLLALGFNILSINRKARKYRKNPKELFLEDRLKPIYKAIKKVFYIKRIEVIAEDFDKIPSKQILFLPNHKSWIDPLVFLKAYYESGKMSKTSIVAKAELSSKKAIRNVITLLDGIFLQRDSGRSIYECYMKQMELIKDGYSMLVYPEGTRVQGDKFGEYKPGVLKVAFQNYIAICPVACYGADNLKQRDKKSGKHKVYLKALKVIQPNKYINTKAEFLMSQIQDDAFAAYKELKKQHMPEVKK